MNPTEKFTSSNINAVQKLTALWALSESGLGGIMFALKIPMTGFFVGGFAVIIVSLIAWFSNRDYKAMVQATILVVMVKALVSPHSPPPAYLAVAFQGLTGALLFRIISSYKLAAVLLGILAMVESAAQKLILMTLVFGKGLWQAVNTFFEQITKDFSLHIHTSYAFWVITIYLALYALWGAVVGSWAAAVPKQIEANKADVLYRYANEGADEQVVSAQKKKSKRLMRILFFAGVLFFIAGIFIWTGAGSKQVLWIFLRSVAAILLLFFVVGPFMKYGINKWLAGRSPEKKQAAGELIYMLPGMRTYVAPAYRLANTSGSPFKKLRNFILYMIILALYGK